MNKIRTTEPRVIWNIKCKLGEGTLWVKEHNSIYFVDIKKKKICILNIKNNKKKQIKVNKDCLLYTSPSPRDLSTSRMPSSA